MTARVLALAACALSVSCGVANGVCSSDTDCGADARCDVAHGLCLQACDDDSQCPSGACTDGVCADEVERSDSGPPPDADAGPDALTVSVSSSPQTVSAGDEVKLEWSASSSAVSCQASAQSVFDDAPSVLSEAPTEGTGSAFVNVNQDTTFLVSCADSEGAIRTADTTVDVEVSGTLTASSDELNAGQPVTLSWQTFGATTCALHDALSDELVLVIETEDVPAGSHTFTPDSTRYRLRCDDVDLSPIDLSIASLGALTSLPAAIGPGAEQVTLSWEYLGPPSCAVRVNGAAHLDEAPASAGHQVTLDASTNNLVVSCTGHDAVLSQTLSVPRLIESFTAVDSVSGEAPPLTYGQGVTLSWEPAAGATCLLNNDDVPSPLLVPALETTGSYTLVCSDASGKSASATVDVLVLPRTPLLSGEIVPRYNGNGDLDGAELVLTATTSLNALACEVQPLGSSDPSSPLPALREDAPDRVFTGTPAVGTATVEYRASCWSDASGALAVTSDETVIVHYGNVSASGGTLTNIGGASLLMGSVALSFNDAVANVAALASLRQVSGHVWFVQLNSTSFTDLDELRIERVIGDVEIRGNAELTSVGKDNVIDAANDQGLAWLQEVYGDVVIEENPSLLNIAMPRLAMIAGDLTVEDNGTLGKISLPALTAVHGALSLTNNPGLVVGATAGDGFEQLALVGNGLTVNGTALDSVDEYFPLLAEIETGGLTVQGNGDLPCTDVVELFCRLAQPQTATVTNNAGSCGWSQEPSCP